MTQGLEEGKSIYQGRSWRLRVNRTKKSAEVIVLIGKRGANRYRIGLTTKEGLNAKRFSIGNVTERIVALLNENRLKTTKMITRVVQPFQLQKALEHVIANKGSAGA